MTQHFHSLCYFTSGHLCVDITPKNLFATGYEANHSATITKHLAAGDRVDLKGHCACRTLLEGVRETTPSDRCQPSDTVLCNGAGSIRVTDVHT